MAQFKEIDDYNFPFEIGVLPRRELALKFADYLNSIGIKATAKPGFGANYSIYVANESDVSKAKLELLRFGNNRADVGASRRGSDAGALVLALSYRDHLELSGVALTDSDLFALRYFAHCL